MVSDSIHHGLRELNGGGHSFISSLSHSHNALYTVGLHHAAIGATRDTRVLILSIYADGFDHCLELEQPSAVLIHRYRPWYCRRDKQHGGQDVTPVKSNLSTQAAGGVTNNVDNTEAVSRRRINELMDQPGNCLRDKRDVLDFIALEGDDLSDIDPPSGSNNTDNNATWMLVDSAAKMMQCIKELQEASPSEIAFDLESYNKSKYTQLTCLLQLTSDVGKEYVIDTLAEGVWDQVGGLRALFADPAIVKIGHSIGGLDVRSLHRDFGIFVMNAFDTYEASQVLKLKHHGLAAVCKHYGLKNGEVYEKLKATYQSGDWHIRPLEEGQIRYGRYDVHYLIKLRKLMMRDLTRAELWDKGAAEQQIESRLISDALEATLQRIQQEEGDVVVGGDDEDDFQSTRLSRVDSNISAYYTPEDSRSLDYSETEGHSEGAEVIRVSIVNAKDLRLQPRLMSVISKSQNRCKDLWSKRVEPHLKNTVFQSMVGRGKRKEIDWDASNIRLYDDLVQWRDKVAAELECLAGFVAPMDLLVQIAHKRPVTEAGLRKITHFLPDVLANSETAYRDELLAIVCKSLLGNVCLSLKDGEVDSDDKAVLLYADRKQEAVSESELVPAPAWGDNPNEGSPVAWKVAVAVAIGASVAAAIVVAKKRRTR